MDERYKMVSMVLPDFPDYEITSEGKVYNVRTGRDMAFTPALNGDLTVGMMQGGMQYRRSVKVLVAKAFVEGHNEIFNTPIQLDCDSRNLRADNIVWRPRWFAWKYKNQFTEHIPDWVYNGPILDVYDDVEYPSIYDAAVANGLLFEDIRWSLLNERMVFPTGQIFFEV